MDKIEIIDLSDDDGEEEPEEENEEDEEESDEEEEEGDFNEEEEGYLAYKDSIKKKTDRELMESIALRLISLESNIKKVQDDLVDTYNLIVEGDMDDEED